MVDADHDQDEYPDEEDEEERYDTTNKKAESERAFYLRFFRFFGTFLVVFAFVLFLLVDEKMTVGFLVIMGLIFLALVCILCHLIRQQSSGGIHDILTEQELQDMEGHGDYEDEDDEYGENTAGASEWMAAHSFQDTPEYVQSCGEEIGTSHQAKQPKSGTYKVVFNAVFFGKSIRSESHMQLTFQRSDKHKSKRRRNNGWIITGNSISGSTGEFHSQRPVDGFVNVRGEMYWKLGHDSAENNDDENITKNLDNGIYRGWFDMRTNSMFDGDFQAGNAPPGRIVRMERTGDLSPIATNGPSAANGATSNVDGGDWGTDDVEMVTMGNDVV